MMGVVARRGDSTTLRVPDEVFGDVAEMLVREGRVVPGLAVEPDGRARSWWWPLPVASHRAMIAALVGTDSLGNQRLAAARLAGEVDRTRPHSVGGGEGRHRTASIRTDHGARGVGPVVGLG